MQRGGDQVRKLLIVYRFSAFRQQHRRAYVRRFLVLLPKFSFENHSQQGILSQRYFFPMSQLVSSAELDDCSANFPTTIFRIYPFTSVVSCQLRLQCLRQEQILRMLLHLTFLSNLEAGFASFAKNSLRVDKFDVIVTQVKLLESLVNCFQRSLPDFCFRVSTI